MILDLLIGFAIVLLSPLLKYFFPLVVAGRPGAL